MKTMYVCNGNEFIILGVFPEGGVAPERLVLDITLSPPILFTAPNENRTIFTYTNMRLDEYASSLDAIHLCAPYITVHLLAQWRLSRTRTPRHYMRCQERAWFDVHIQALTQWTRAMTERGY